MARIVFAGREVWPFVEGGGIGRFVWTAARMLATHHDVTILTGEEHRSAYERMQAAGDPRLPDGVAFAWADVPDGDVRPMSSAGQAWSASLLRGLRGLEPDVVEFADYSGEGFATVHARRTGDRDLAATAVVVRAHATAEIVYALDERASEPANGVLWALERFGVRHADALLWPGGDVLERYRAFYGRVAPEVLSTLPVALDDLPATAASPPADGPLRLLYLGRLQRVKGVAELVDAVLGDPDLDLRLTLVGGDTDSAPGGGSMREHLLARADGDPRIEVRDRVSHDEVAGLVAEHHVVTVPTRWETYSYVTREALAANRPVLATRVGSIPEVVAPGRSGWHAGSSRPGDLAAALRDVSYEEALELIGAGLPRAALLDALQTPDDLAETYQELVPRPERAPARPLDAVSAIVAVTTGDDGLAATMLSLRRQRGIAVRTVLVATPAWLPDAASTLDADEVVLAGRPGWIAGWAAGVAATTGPLVLLVHAGAELDPSFARRGAEALARGSDFAYVTAMAKPGRFPWHAPLGGEDLAASGADAGASVALARRDVVLRALTASPATERELWSGLPGAVIQEPLVRRVRHRPPDPAPPAHGGAPDPGSVAAAFGGLL